MQTEKPSDAKSRIQVYVRVRPPNAEEQEESLVFVDKQNARVVVKKQFDVKSFDFDYVFAQESTQEEIFNTVAIPTIEDSFNGYHGTVFVYGQTGTGKTFTISSPKPNAGIIPRALDYIFARCNADTTCKYTIEMSYVQIYMENLQDLLSLNSQQKCQIREDPDNGVFLTGCTVQQVISAEEALALYKQGDDNRSTALTKMNATSSRSHACLILTIHKRRTITQSDFENGTSLARTMTSGKLYLVDLAGSERIKKTEATGIRKQEANYINLSLTNLGLVINALETGKAHIPFRDSKLTRLLQDSLGGRGKTSIIVTIGPSSEHIQETISTLQFGQRAMKVKTKAKIFETIDYKALSAKLQAQIDELETEKMQLEQDVDELLTESERMTIVIDQGKQDLELAKQQIEELKRSHETDMEQMRELLESEKELLQSNFQDQNKQMQQEWQAKIDAANEQMLNNDRTLKQQIQELQEQASNDVASTRGMMEQDIILLTEEHAERIIQIRSKHQAEISQLNEKISHLTECFEAKESQALNLEQQIGELRKQIDLVNATCAQQKATIETQEQVLKHAENKIQLNQDQYVSLKKELDSILQLADHLKSELDETQQRKYELETNNSALQVQCMKLSQDIASQDFHMRELNATVASKEAKIMEMQNSHAKESEVQNSKNVQLHNENFMLKTKYETLVEQFDDVKRLVTKRDARILELEKEKEIFINRNDELLSLLAQQDAKSGELIVALNESFSKLQIEEEKRSIAEKAVRDNSEEVTELQKRLVLAENNLVVLEHKSNDAMLITEVTSKELNILKMSYAEQCKHISMKEDMIRDLISRNEVLQKSLAASQHEQSLLSSEYNNLKLANVALTEQIQEALNSAGAVLPIQVDFTVNTEKQSVFQESDSIHHVNPCDNIDATHQLQLMTTPLEFNKATGTDSCTIEHRTGKEVVDTNLTTSHRESNCVHSYAVGNILIDSTTPQLTDEPKKVTLESNNEHELQAEVTIVDALSVEMQNNLKSAMEYQNMSLTDSIAKHELHITRNENLEQIKKQNVSEESITSVTSTIPSLNATHVVTPQRKFEQSPSNSLIRVFSELQERYSSAEQMLKATEEYAISLFTKTAINSQEFDYQRALIAALERKIQNQNSTIEQLKAQLNEQTRLTAHTEQYLREKETQVVVLNEHVACLQHELSAIALQQQTTMETKTAVETRLQETLQFVDSVQNIEISSSEDARIVTSNVFMDDISACLDQMVNCVSSITFVEETSTHNNSDYVNWLLNKHAQKNEISIPQVSRKYINTTSVVLPNMLIQTVDKQSNSHTDAFIHALMTKLAPPSQDMGNKLLFDFQSILNDVEKLHNREYSYLLFLFQQSCNTIQSMKNALFECANELNHVSLTYQEFQKHREKEKSVERTIRAVMLLQRKWRGMKRKQIEREERIAKEQNLLAQQEIAKLKKAQGEFMKSLNEHSSRTGFLLMQQSFAEIQQYFRIWFQHFAYEPEDVQQTRKMSTRTSPSTKNVHGSPRVTVVDFNSPKNSPSVPHTQRVSSPLVSKIPEPETKSLFGQTPKTKSRGFFG